VLAGLAPQLTGGSLSGSLTKTDGHSIGLLFQDADAQLFNMTAADEIAFGLETGGLSRAQMHERVQYWLRWAGLEGMDARAPWRLSGGQKKRLALAAVLAQSPNIIILDDPTASLDPLGAEEVLETLNTLRKGGQHALCLTTSDPELALRYADRVLLMEAGQIVLEGSPREIAQQSERLRAVGVGAPQLVELAQALTAGGRPYDFISLDDATEALRHCTPRPAGDDHRNSPTAGAALQ
jgi:energy-coupling factor transporter ATP-binding protein EcfA2